MITASLLILGGQVMTLFFQLGNYLLRSFDFTRLRFLLISIYFFVFNAVWFYLLSFQLEYNDGIKHIIMTSVGLLLSIGYYVHLSKELLLKNLGSSFSNNRIVLIFSLIFSIILALSLFLFGQFSLVLSGFLSGCLSTVMIIAWRLLLVLSASEFKVRIASSRVFVFGLFFGMLVTISLPTILAIEGLGMIGLITANIAYLAVFVSYLAFFVQQSAIENALLIRSKVPSSVEDRESVIFSSDQFEALTNSERIVCFHILKGYKHREIADMLSVTTNTITSHASHIYIKLNCSGQKDFRKKYKHLVEPT